MSEFQNQPTDADDPGLTAFALGELDGPEAARYAALASNSPAIQALVHEIQEEARMLSDELRSEPVLPLSPERRTAIIALSEHPIPTSQNTRTNARTRWVRWIAVATGSAAIITVVAISLPRTRHHEVASDTFKSWQKPLEMSRDSSRHEEKKSEVKSVSRDLALVSAGSRPGPQPGAPQGESPEVRMKLADAGEMDLKQSVKDAEESSPDLRQPLLAGAGNRSNVRRGNGPQPTSEPYFNKSPVSSVATSKPHPFGDAQDDNSRFSIAKSESKAEIKGPASGQEPGDRPEGLSVADTSKTAGKSSKLEEALPESLRLDKKRRGFENLQEGMSQRKSGGSEAARPNDKYEPSGRIDANGKAMSSTSPTKPGQPRTSDRKRADSKKETVDELADHPSVAPNVPAAAPAPGKGDQSKPDSLAVGNGKPHEYAFAEYRRALETERLHPGSIPLEQLSKLRQASGPQRVADPTGAEAYRPIFENPFISPTQEALSTFSIDVDSASFANVRRFLMGGQVPPPDAVRIEELVNYFAYQYPVPQDGKPFSVNSDIAACPWSPDHHLVRIGLKGKEIPKDQRPPSSLVFLVDVSGSMSAENKLPLVRSSLKTLVGQLDERDRIAIVTYAGEAGIRLPSTPLTQRETILSAIDGLGAGGSTNGAAGINTAYDIAAKEFIEKGTNRVILCTDGDFNVGVTSDDALVQMIQTRAKGGVFLSVFGFGMGNLKDSKLEQLADKGNGQYGYIDDRQEADKVFIQEVSGTLVTIAKDVKIQIDFNKDAVAAYRLIGYENRILATEDFHDDKKDAGEIGAGHTVTALYEIVPVKDLKPNDQTRWMSVKLRYKQPEATVSELIESPLMGQPGQLKLASSDFQFAASVASFGMLLRNSQHAGQSNWGMVKELAQSGLSNDQYGHRSGFRRLVDQAESLLGERRPAAPPEPDSTVNGKYKSLLRRLNVPEDAQKYGQFSDYGFDQTKTYGGAENLPEGYWVYVAPYWYIWGESTQAK